MFLERSGLFIVGFYGWGLVGVGMVRVWLVLWVISGVGIVFKEVSFFM